MALYDDILDLSRQAQRGPLSSWFERRLHDQINSGLFLPETELQRVGDALIGELIGYRQQAGADSDEVGQLFRRDVGHAFRFQAGHDSDLKSAT